MTDFPKISRIVLSLAIGCSLLALAGCYKRSSNSTEQKQGAAVTAPAAPVAATGCSTSPPDKAAIGAALTAALLQIYGPDQGSAKYTVATTQMPDCQHMNVTYHLVSPHLDMFKASLVYADGQWTIPMYGKSYQVK